MIIIKDKTKITKVFCPKAIPTSDMLINMLLTGETDGKEYMLHLIDIEYSGDYFEFEIDANELPDQEYKYQLFNTENLFLGSGLMRVGDYASKKIVTKEHKNTIDLL